MTFEGLLTQLDPRPDRRGRQFERICKWYLQAVPEYHLEVRHAWLWDEWPGRWAADAGIDLVVETVSGDLWAVQAKAYDPAHTIKKADVDSFLSESSRAEFAYRLLIATTDRIGSTARRTIAAQEKPAGLLLRSQLGLAEVEWPRSPADLKPRPPKRKRPRPHQRKAVTAVVRGFETADRGQLIMACGTGKTLAACFLAQSLHAGRVLVLVPSLSLLAQTLREWALASEFSYLAVCSDETVTGNDDAIVASTSEFGFPVTTDPAVISGFLRKRGDEMRVVFATYQSSPRIAEAQAEQTRGFDLVIADEAHRCGGPEAGIFATVLDNKKIKAQKRLFMTATPRYFTGRVRKEAREADWEIASMDDESRFGPVLHRLSFAEAIEQGLLSDYQVAVVGVSDATYREYAERGVFVTDGERVTDARTLASQLGLLRAMARYRLHRVVSFHSRIRSASTFAGSLPDVYRWLPDHRRPDGSLWATYVSGEMSSGERDVRLNRLRAVGDSEFGVLANARCLSEGVDVPTLDGIAFVDPRRSQIDVVQAVGRAIRKTEGKSVGTIVIPVFVDENAEPEDALDSGEFRRVWDVVKALRAHDEVLAEELDELRRALGRRSTAHARPSKILVDLPVSIGDTFARAFDARLVAKTTAQWEFWFGLLQRYTAREGHARVPKEHVEDGHTLGTWVNTQRRRYGIAALPTERAQQLESLPGWIWSLQDARWEEQFESLQRFLARERHGRVPAEYADENGFRLGRWVIEQRRALVEHPERLSGGRRARLEEIPGWLWTTGVKRAEKRSWDERFANLLEFVEREGHSRVPPSHVENGQNLGVWLMTQRDAYRRRLSRMTPERASRLSALPDWFWSESDDPAWEQNFRRLEQFVAREGHARVPLSHVEDGYNLGRWVSNQRADYARQERRMTPERVSRLEGVPGWSWRLRKGLSWDGYYGLLEQFVAREGDSRVPVSHLEDGHWLGAWVSNQRQDYAQGAGSLTAARIARLEAVPGWSWLSRADDAWEKGFSRLLAFVEREGHGRVPGKQRDEGGYRLGYWIASQRQDYAQGAGSLTAARIARLEAVPGWSWSLHVDAWETGFARLLAFVERTGNARVARTHVDGDGYSLGEWVSVQRREHRAGRMSDQRASRLEALPGWSWDASEFRSPRARAAIQPRPR